MNHIDTLKEMLANLDGFGVVYENDDRMAALSSAIEQMENKPPVGDYDAAIANFKQLALYGFFVMGSVTGNRAKEYCDLAISCIEYAKKVTKK